MLCVAARIIALYPAIFPEEDLRPLVTSLLNGDARILSLAAFDGGEPVAHILFTLFEGSGGTGALLGPLGVLPRAQRRGLGSALIADGMARLGTGDVDQVFVLGDPAYYSRAGFQPERAVMPPYPMPEKWRDAWQSRKIEGRTALAPGRCTLPDPWMNRALWLP